MMHDDRLGQGEEMVRRARNVAIGLADVGLTQAEDMLRRMSPEGRALARREREARRRRLNRLTVRLAYAALASMLLWAVLTGLAGPGLATLAAVAAMIVSTMLIVQRSAPVMRGREALVEAALPDLAAATTVWLAAQRRGLPSPAVPLVETLTRGLDSLSVQTAYLDPRSPAADAVRKLIMTELPNLIERWRAVPLSMRGVAQADGATPNARLVEGLQLINGEVNRMTDHLARGALDAVTVQGRYLELKYGAGALGDPGA
jgi:hypothetical protein